MLMNGTPMAGGEMMGAAEASHVDVSITYVEVKLSDLLQEAHAINVHLSAERIGDYIACGELGGQMMGDSLVIGLREQNASGHSGIAVLQGVVVDKADTTAVHVYLAEGLTGGGTAGAEATPTT
jgi:hypothetical protein